MLWNIFVFICHPTGLQRLPNVWRRDDNDNVTSRTGQLTIIYRYRSDVETKRIFYVELFIFIFSRVLFRPVFRLLRVLRLAVTRHLLRSRRFPVASRPTVFLHPTNGINLSLALSAALWLFRRNNSHKKLPFYSHLFSSFLLLSLERNNQINTYNIPIFLFFFFLLALGGPLYPSYVCH